MSPASMGDRCPGRRRGAILHASCAVTRVLSVARYRVDVAFGHRDAAAHYKREPGFRSTTHDLNNRAQRRISDTSGACTSSVQHGSNQSASTRSQPDARGTDSRSRPAAAKPLKRPGMLCSRSLQIGRPSGSSPRRCLQRLVRPPVDGSPARVPPVPVAESLFITVRGQPTTVKADGRFRPGWLRVPAELPVRGDC